MTRRRAAEIGSLEEHPNLEEIVGVLSQLADVTDADLPRLADAWRNSSCIADARDAALSVDSPLVLEVLAAFEAVQALFADDLAGDQPYVTVDPGVTTTALKAIRDAIAAAYARPVLTRSQHADLMAPWRRVYPVDAAYEPALGPRGGEVKAMLAAMPRLATRCHDDRARADFEEIVRASWIADADLRSVARDEAWAAAVLAGRRRTWALVRRSGTEAIGRYCATCRHRNSDDDSLRVLELCLDAACALLVADAIDDTLVEVLTLPVSRLIPEQRTASE